MLAGKMKLKTFITLVVGVVVVFGLVCLGVTILVPGVAGVALWSGGAQQATPVTVERVDAAPIAAPATPAAATPSSSAPATPAAATPATPAPTTAAATPAGDARPFEALLFERAGTDLGTTKLKDVTKGKTYKVSLYQDDGHTTMNRAKVDVDRDDKWDEKWTVDGTNISRKVAPNDDEDYTETWIWDGSAWVPEG